MIELQPNVFYTRQDLAELLRPAGIDVDHFIARLKARKVFRSVWLGSDLIEAYRKVTPLEERDQALCQKRYRKPVTIRRAKKSQGLIGGTFTPEEIGLK